MTHLEIENLASEYLEGHLTSMQRAQVENHLEACAHCRSVIEDVQSAIQACQAADKIPPPPWLAARILAATLNQRQPTLLERVAAVLRGLQQPRLAYGIAMIVFSVSLLANVSGLRLQSLSMEDLNPSTWYNEASRTGHLFYARAEKFCYDLRIVYEIESRFRQVEPEPRPPEIQPSPRLNGPERSEGSDLSGKQVLAYENTRPMPSPTGQAQGGSAS